MPATNLARSILSAGFVLAAVFAPVSSRACLACVADPLETVLVAELEGAAAVVLAEPVGDRDEGRFRVTTIYRGEGTRLPYPMLKKIRTRFDPVAIRAELRNPASADRYSLFHTLLGICGNEEARTSPNSDTGSPNSSCAARNSAALDHLIDEALRPRPPGRLRRSVSLRSADE